MGLLPMVWLTLRMVIIGGSKWEFEFQTALSFKAA